MIDNLIMLIHIFTTSILIYIFRTTVTDIAKNKHSQSWPRLDLPTIILEFYYFHYFLIYFDYFFFIIIIRYKYTICFNTISYIILPSSIMAMYWLNFYFAFSWKYFPNPPCASVRRPGEFSFSIYRKGRDASIISIQLATLFPSASVRHRPQVAPVTHIQLWVKKKGTRYFLHARTCRNKGRLGKGRAGHEGTSDSRGVASQKWIQLNSHTRRARAEPCRDVARPWGRKDDEGEEGETNQQANVFIYGTSCKRKLTSRKFRRCQVRGKGRACTIVEKRGGGPHLAGNGSLGCRRRALVGKKRADVSNGRDRLSMIM